MESFTSLIVMVDPGSSEPFLLMEGFGMLVMANTFPWHTAQ
jgi:hypothetical protein